MANRQINAISHMSIEFDWFSAGDQVRRGGLPTPGPHGLPRCPPHPNAGLLAERPQRKTQILPDRHGPGQADPEPREPQVNGHIVQVSAGNRYATFGGDLPDKCTLSVSDMVCIKSRTKLTRKFRLSGWEYDWPL